MGCFWERKRCCRSWDLPPAQQGSGLDEIKCWAFLQISGGARQVVFQQRPVVFAGCCLQHPSLRGCTVVQRHHSCAGSETWKCLAGQAGVVVSGMEQLWFPTPTQCFEQAVP